MNKTITIATVLLFAAVAATGQPPAVPPSGTPVGPVHEKLPSLIKGPSKPKIITKDNRRYWSANFKIDMRDTSMTVSNLFINVELKRKYKLENLQSVDLVVSETPKKTKIWVKFNAELFVPLWRRDMFEKEQDPDAAVYSSFVISRELSRKAFLRLECFSSRSASTGSQRLNQRPTSVYLIDLNSFAPTQSPPKHKKRHESGDDTIDINFTKHVDFNKKAFSQLQIASANAADLSVMRDVCYERDNE
jgi:hypothetical protein